MGSGLGSGLVLTRTANQHAAGLPVRLETWSLTIQGQLKAPHLKLKMRTWADECRVEAVFLNQVAQAHTRSHTRGRLQPGPPLGASLSSGEL